ncbi:MAG TPA: hypothetical protein VHI71_06630 [Actinomycetota bacterium]|nr:hypothetical protein [Actinomycetota bacterium]
MRIARRAASAGLRRRRMLLAAALVAVPAGMVTAEPAAACPTHGGCPSRCKVNPPFYVTDGGDIYPSGRPLVECYY